jgi:phosphoadenosine phosphosulfate reductase
MSGRLFDFIEGDDPQRLAIDLNFAEKVQRATDLARMAFDEYGHDLVVANSLGKDSMVVWHLAQAAVRGLRGFIVTTQFKPAETVAFMGQVVGLWPSLLGVYRAEERVPEGLPGEDPQGCCRLLKVLPMRRALQELGARCWMTGLRCTEGHTRSEFREVERWDEGLVKLNPILTFTEAEVWQYAALHGVPMNPLYAEGYRSLGCSPCTLVTASGQSERSGRWRGTVKAGGECGIHSGPILGECMGCRSVM